MSRTTSHDGPDGGLARNLQDLKRRVKLLESRTQGPRIFGPFVTNELAVDVNDFNTLVGFHNLDLTPESYEVFAAMSTSTTYMMPWAVGEKGANSVSFKLDYTLAETAPGATLHTARVRARFFVAVAAPGEFSF